MKKFVAMICMSGMCLVTKGQHYQALHGSPFSGSLTIANNPASMLGSPYKWDVSIGAQVKNSTNIVIIHKYSLLTSPYNSEYEIKDGNFSRRGLTNFNVNVLNTRLLINRRRAIGFGLNLRGYGSLKTDRYNYDDSIRSTGEFFALNENIRTFNGKANAAAWVEFFVSYAQTFRDTDADRLNGGISLKANRGLFGGHAALNNLAVQKTIQTSNPIFSLIQGSVEYGYSSNTDYWNSSRSTTDNVRQVFRASDGGISMDLGVEYLIKPQAVISVYDEDPYYDYEWKFGLSVLDLGVSQYRYSANSRSISGFRDNVTDQVVDNKFGGVEGIRQFNDSLFSIVSTSDGKSGNFFMMHPTRVVVNADRPVYPNFYLNAELSLGIASLFNKQYLTPIDLLTITPRYENKRWGVFLPIQYNVGGQFWIGGAFKAGPLVIGIHNWSNIFSQKKMQNGGGYLALILRPWQFNSARLDKRLNCPD